MVVLRYAAVKPVPVGTERLIRILFCELSAEVAEDIERALLPNKVELLAADNLTVLKNKLTAGRPWIFIPHTAFDPEAAGAKRLTITLLITLTELVPLISSPFTTEVGEVAERS